MKTTRLATRSALPDTRGFTGTTGLPHSKGTPALPDTRGFAPRPDTVPRTRHPRRAAA